MKDKEGHCFFSFFFQRPFFFADGKSIRSRMASRRCVAWKKQLQNAVWGEKMPTFERDVSGDFVDHFLCLKGLPRGICVFFFIF